MYKLYNTITSYTTTIPTANLSSFSSFIVGEISEYGQCPNKDTL